MKKPEPDTKLIRACIEYIDFLSSEDYHEDRLSDYENYIFEAALEFVYGDNIWDYVKEKIR